MVTSYNTIKTRKFSISTFHQPPGRPRSSRSAACARSVATGFAPKLELQGPMNLDRLGSTGMA